MVEIKGVLAQLARYLLVGGFAFLVDFGLFAFCLYVLGWHYLLANFMDWLLVWYSTMPLASGGFSRIANAGLKCVSLQSLPYSP